MGLGDGQAVNEQGVGGKGGRGMVGARQYCDLTDTQVQQQMMLVN